MKKPEQKTANFFVDESGDPVFYGKGGAVIVGTEGCSKVFIMGFVEAENPEVIRHALSDLRSEIEADAYFQGVKSLTKSLRSFHAKDDAPEIRMLVYKKLAELDFKAQVVVARKVEPMFRTRYKGSQYEFYNDLVARLFQNSMHKAMRNRITYARRGSKARRNAFLDAVHKGYSHFRKRWGHDIRTHIDVIPQYPSEEPVLQVTDYVNWSVQRAYHANEMRYFEVVRDKVSLVLDVFDRERYKGGANYYSREKNPFDITKVSSLD